MFWDFGSLHQKHRVGVRWSAGRQYWGRGCVHLPPTIAFWARGLVPKFVTDVVWTVYEVAGPVLPDGCDVAASFLTRCRGSRISRPCRCGDSGFISHHKPAEHRIPDVSATPDVEASSITSCCGRRVSSLFTFSLFHSPCYQWCQAEGRTSVSVRFRLFSLSIPGVAASQSSMQRTDCWYSLVSSKSSNDAIVWLVCPF